MSFNFEPIGHVHSCFREKFAIPRQPRLAPASRATIELLPPYNQVEATEGLESVSHIWVLFVFHAAPSGDAHLRVRPPRLGGNRKIGVFASRATHRPNPIGQSVVTLEAIEPGKLLISGHDLLHGTPVLDIKPYVPYVDAVTTATNSLASTAPELIEVQWAPEALRQAHAHADRLGQPVVELVEQCLAQDPKPAYQQPSPDRQYGALFWDFNVTWHYPSADRICVLGLLPVCD